MLSRSDAIKIFISANIVSWLLLLVVNLANLFGLGDYSSLSVPVYLKGLLLNLFLIFTFFYYKVSLDSREEADFTDLLSQVFVTGFATAMVSLLTLLVLYMLGSHYETGATKLNVIFYHINIGLVTVFLTKAFFVWKKMILYKKTHSLLYLWNTFEYALLASMVFHFFDLDRSNAFFVVPFAALSLVGLVLSGNLKWVAYLNFRQKWQCIVLILLITAFAFYFAMLFFRYSANQNQELTTNLIYSVYILVLFTFVAVYSLFSLLVILFNLPTSAVFEKKLEEIVNFQQLTQSLQMGREVEQVYEILLESSVKSVLADAAWLEINDAQGLPQKFIQRNITMEEANEVKQYLRQSSSFQNMLLSPLLKNLKKKPDRAAINLPYKSVMYVPLIVQDQPIGSLALLKTIQSGFDRENTEIVNTVVRMACLSLENVRLMARALENERYQEALNIARRVQQNLLPSAFESHKHLEISAYSQAADDVGGDYYDLFNITERKVALIIGDVSGKGTSAAFNMAQLKGVFHSLVELDLPPDQFLWYANSALSRCLEKSSFITASFFSIDTETRTAQFARAGHCPTLYFCNRTQRTYFLEDKGMGLGVLRDERYLNYIQMKEFHYDCGDLMLLYTDGVTEARNDAKEEFGYGRLKAFLEKNHGLSLIQLQERLLDELHHFCGTKNLYDDYTVLFIKFR